ncbi:MAG: Rieske (2Fe-2S) protein [Ignavibacteria bacterium]|nr:Rieske (2Fe-2S) protein [Ignavibacteria bacterium]
MKGFEKICRLSDLPERRGRKFTIEGDTDIAVFKIQGEVFAVSNICPHNKSQVMYDGYVDEELYLSCPVHGWKFSLKTGETPPECRNTLSKLKTYQVVIENGEVWVKPEKKKMWFW